MKIKVLFACLVGLVLTACATNTETVLINERGDKRYCYLMNDHTLNSMGAVSEYNRCLNDAGASGFRKVKD
jgi:hypothetical protein